MIGLRASLPGLLACVLSGPGIGQQAAPQTPAALRSATVAAFAPIARAAGQGVAPVLEPKLKLQPSGANLFAVLAAAFGKVKLDALRTWTDYGGSKVISIQERLRVAPAKGFRLELVSIRENGSSSVGQEAQYRAMRYPDSAAYFYLFRDFRVRDVVRADQNYEARPMGSLVRDGRKLSIFDVLPKIANRCRYRILVDALTGLALDRIEFDPSGKVVSTLFYDPAATRLGKAADAGLSKAQWWKPWMLVQDFSSLSEASKTLSFQVRLPQKLDTGFGMSMVRTTRTDSTSENWLVVGYDDGIASRVVVQSKVAPSDRWIHFLEPKHPGEVPILNYRLGPHAQFLARYNGIQYLMIGSFPSGGIPKMFDDILR